MSSPPARSSTPDLLADTPPQQQPPPDDDRLDLASSRPQRVLRGRSSPGRSPRGLFSESPEPSPPPSGTLPGVLPAPSAAGPSGTAAELQQPSQGSVPGVGGGQGAIAPSGPAPPAPAEVAVPESEAALPQGCYSTLAAHDRGPHEGSLGHELPSCFGTTDPNMRRSSSPPRAAAPYLSSQGSAASSSSLSGDRRSSREASPEAPARAVSPAKEVEKVRGSSQPLSGLRDLLAPVGGLFKGAFGVPSSDGAAQESSSRAQSGGSQHGNGNSAPEGTVTRESDSSGMSEQPGASALQSAILKSEDDMDELSEEYPAYSAEVSSGSSSGVHTETLAGPSGASVQQHGFAGGDSGDVLDEHQTSVEERSRQAKQDLMDVFSSQHAASAQPPVHSSSFAASMQPQQVCTFSAQIVGPAQICMEALRLSLLLQILHHQTNMKLPRPRKVGFAQAWGGPACISA